MKNILTFSTIFFLFSCKPPMNSAVQTVGDGVSCLLKPTEQSLPHIQTSTDKIYYGYHWTDKLKEVSKNGARQMIESISESVVQTTSTDDKNMMGKGMYIATDAISSWTFGSVLVQFAFKPGCDVASFDQTLEESRPSFYNSSASAIIYPWKTPILALVLRSKTAVDTQSVEIADLSERNKRSIFDAANIQMPASDTTLATALRPFGSAARNAIGSMYELLHLNYNYYKNYAELQAGLASAQFLDAQGEPTALGMQLLNATEYQRTGFFILSLLNGTNTPPPGALHAFGYLPEGSPLTPADGDVPALVKAYLQQEANKQHIRVFLATMQLVADGLKTQNSFAAWLPKDYKGFFPDAEYPIPSPASAVPTP